MTSTSLHVGGGRATVLDLEADDLRADRPVDDLGADSTTAPARVRRRSARRRAAA